MFPKPTEEVNAVDYWRNIKRAQDRKGSEHLYPDCDELIEEIQEYFTQCDGCHEVYTVTGLALFLGYCDISNLRRARKRDNEQAIVLESAVSYIGRQHEAALSRITGQTSGAVFWLKNHGWNAEEQQEVTVHDGFKINIPRPKRKGEEETE